MNDITEAMEKAGVRLPHPRQRVWTHVKHNPGISHQKMRAALKLTESQASQAGLALEEAGLMTVVHTRTRGKNGRSVPCKSYTTNPKFPDYVDGPKVASNKNASKNKAPAPPKPKDPPIIIPCDTVELKLPTALVEDLKEACAVLERYFGFKPTLVQCIAFALKKGRDGAWGERT